MTQGVSTRRFWAALIRVGIVACLAVLLLAPTISSLDKGSDTARIEKFRGHFELSSDGRLDLTEVIDVWMSAGKHGIFRIFDTKDPRRRAHQYPLDGVTVTRNGSPEPFTWEKVSSRSRTAKIGSASVMLPYGVHRYVIRSRTHEALERGSGGTTVWWWDVVGSGWQMSMSDVAISADLPAVPQSVQCVRDERTPCEAVVRGRSLRVDVGSLNAFEPVTLRVTFPAGALPEPSEAGKSWLGYWGPAIFAALLAAGLGLWLVSRTREQRPGFPVLFEPPAGVSPALGAKLLYETDSKHDLQATLFDLGERGVLSLEGGEGDWNLRVVGDPKQARLTAAEDGLLTALGLTAQGSSFHVADTESSGLTLTGAQSGLRGAVGVESGIYLRKTPVAITLKVLSALSLVGLVAIAAMYFFGDIHTPWVITAFTAAFGFVTAGTLLDPAASTVHSEHGIDTWSRVGGFARFITTDSSETRFEAAERLDWYQRYLPWAVALGVGDKWAERYRAQGVEPPSVPWILWYGSPADSSALDSIGDSFTTSISSAVSTYEASQSSSSGGGFSGGSGGGGGGGGSW